MLRAPKSSSEPDCVHLCLQKSNEELAEGDLREHFFPVFGALLCSGALIVCGTAAFLHVLAQIYSHEGSKADQLTIINRAFKSIPSAAFRQMVTLSWSLPFVELVRSTGPPVLAACFLSIRDARAPAWEDFHVEQDSHLSKIWGMLCDLIFHSFLFMFSVHVAVLEPESYGRAAIKKGLRLVRGRNAAVVLEFCLFWYLISSVFLEHLEDKYFGTEAVEMEMTPGFTFWLFFSVLKLAVSVCFSLASMVMYFVCKSSLEDHALSSSSSNEGNGNGTQSASFFWNEKMTQALKLAVKVILLLSLIMWFKFGNGMSSLRIMTLRIASEQCC